jgi:hypothetical protein
MNLPVGQSRAASAADSDTTNTAAGEMKNKFKQ